MEIIIERGCGLDVHKGTVVACIMGTGIKKEVRTYTTLTTEIKRVASEEWDNPCGRGKHQGLRSKYHSLVGRRGKKKALVALGHKILIMCYHILKYRRPYKELGVDYLDRKRKDKIARSYIRRLHHLGYEVILQDAA